MENVPAKPTVAFPVDTDGAPKITLAGKEWAVPPLAIAQAKHAVPAIMSIMPVIGPLIASSEGNDPAKILAGMQLLTEDVYEAIATAVFWSIKRGTPGIGRGEFDEMPISLQELMAAIPVVMSQIGFLKQAGPGDAPAGEPQAVGQPISIGTDSSPKSAA